MARQALCLGSAAKSIRTTRRALEIFGGHLLLKEKSTAMPALAAGETGDPMWSKRQLDAIAELPQVKVLRKGTFDETGRYIDAPLLRLEEGKTITAAELNLFFTTRVNEAYGPFERFCKDNKLSVPLLVGINTIDILLLALPFNRVQLLDAFIERTRLEAEEIWRRTGGNVVFLIESPMATILANLSETFIAKLFPGRHSLMEWLIEAFLKLLQALPQGAKWGFHFCFGRVGNKAMWEKFRAVAYKTKRTVDFSNRLFAYLAQHGFIPLFVHYALRFGRLAPSTHASDYEDFRRLILPETVLVFAGAIDPSLPLDVQLKIYEMLDTVFRRTVGVAATCGYGSVTLEEMEASLRRMYEVAHYGAM